jgi:hypothetical protein
MDLIPTPAVKFGCGLAVSHAGSILQANGVGASGVAVDKLPSERNLGNLAQPIIGIAHMPNRAH